MNNTLNVADAKKRLSEIMSRVAYKGERFIIQRRGKPMAALVSPEDLRQLEFHLEAPRGLLAALGAWADFEGLDRVVDQIYDMREKAVDRTVALEE
ncbi:MAG: type II toxin-antitoxin system Phd/YefM family antitoxin [Chloroflexi bacterium]|nr:type II toxin-antitoxin system Phd/YefM family antitoxin [Chloroflexota bacterium]